MPVEDCPEITYCFQGWDNINRFDTGGDTYRYDGGAAFTYTESDRYTFADWDMNFRTFVAVPEPDVWALLVIGFGAVRLSLRRRAAVTLLVT